MRKLVFRNSQFALLLALMPLMPSLQQPLPPLQDGQTIPLWSGPAPGALGAADSDIPTIAVFLPRTMTQNTPAVIVCPGGSYVSLAMNHEGRQVASYLNSLGMAAFVLRYRLGPRYHHPIELGDAQRAIRTLRAHASEWRLDAARIGIMGFSAGGHLRRGGPGGACGKPAGFRRAGLSRDFDDRDLDASGIEEQPPWKQSGPGAGEKPFRRAGG